MADVGILNMIEKYMNTGGTMDVNLKKDTWITIGMLTTTAVTLDDLSTIHYIPLPDTNLYSYYTKVIIFHNHKENRNSE